MTLQLIAEQCRMQLFSNLVACGKKLPVSLFVLVLMLQCGIPQGCSVERGPQTVLTTKYVACLLAIVNPKTIPNKSYFV